MDLSFLTRTGLFRGTNEGQAQSMLNCLGAYTKHYSKGEMIFHVGEIVDAMGLVLLGGVNIETDDVWGNKSILSHVEPGEIFGETYACIPGSELMVNVVATERTQVLFLQAAQLMQTCPHTCAHHARLIKNLLQISAQKNLELSRRILHTSSKTIRGRLYSYFSEQVLKSGSYQITIPFNRQQLADYLGVDRSALSNELSKMQKEGLITYDKNMFQIKKGQGVRD